MGRYVEKKNLQFFSPNVTENTQESNVSRFTCRCIYTTPGSYTFTVPVGVSTITAVAVGPGGCANSIAKVNEKYVYTIFESLNTCRYQVLCCCTNNASDLCGNISASTCLGSYFLLSGRNCFRFNNNNVYSQIEYVVFDSAPGGGYAEKQITTAPGCAFNVVVGCYGGNNYSCVAGQICATGPTISDGTGISTSCQYICRCPCLFCTCYNLAGCYRYECYGNSGVTCYISQKVTNSVLTPGCGFGGTINRKGGFGCTIQTFCFPLGFDDLNYDQCNCVCCFCVATCNTPVFGWCRNINICSSIVADANTCSLAVCPCIGNNWCCYFVPTACICSWKGSSGNCNCFSYFDCLTRVSNYSSTFYNFDLTSCFLVCPCYCCVCLSSTCSNFVGLVTAVTNLSISNNNSGGSSSGSPCFDGNYPSTTGGISASCSTADLPCITSVSGGRPVFTTWYATCCGYTVLDHKIYTKYNPIGVTSDLVALIANTGCNPCNCSDIGCFYCTQKFDPIRNMWGIISGPACFAFGAAGIGNSLALCDPFRWSRNTGCGCIGFCCIGIGLGTCAVGCCATLSHYGTVVNGIRSLWCCYGYTCCNTYSCTYIYDASIWCQTLYHCRCCNSCTISWPCTSYWPTSTCWNCFGGACCTTIPVINLYELLCDSAGKCISFCCTCTDIGKQFQTLLAEQGNDAIKAHFSPCTCSVKCFGTYCDWPCYFASVGVGTTIPCGGNSPLVPRQELTVCDPRFTANQFHNLCINNVYSFSAVFNNNCLCNIWGNQTGLCCVYCNTFASARSSLSRAYSIGNAIEAASGIGYSGRASTNTCCLCYFVGSSTCGYSCACVVPQCYTEVIAITDYGGGGGAYSGPVSTKIYRIGRCSSVIISPSGGKGWGDYDEVLSENDSFNAPRSQPKFTSWFDVIQAKGSGARGAICIDSICYAPVQAGPGGGAIGGFGSPYDSTCVFGGAACCGTAGPGGGAGGKGVPGTGMVVIYWNP